MRLPMTAALALLVAAGAAQAQRFEGSCQPHRNGEVRCAARSDPRNMGNYDITLRAVRGTAGEGRIIADAWRSVCGSAGNLQGSVNMGNNEAQRIASFNHQFGSDAAAMAQTAFGMCVEVFIRSCTANGRATSCQDVINIGASRITVGR
jgi:hypothetical protein